MTNGREAGKSGEGELARKGNVQNLHIASASHLNLMRPYLERGMSTGVA